ncbi:MAG: choice-of-anchor L domain-containing protein [Flavobacteriales bacterium]
MAQNLAGPGVQISNAQITGADSSYAYYYANATEIGTSNGVLLTSGRAEYAIGPNNQLGICNTIYNPPFPLCSYFDRDTPGSELLEESQLECPPDQEVCTNDACMLEFDIVPQGYNLSFNYTFASEEYLAYVNSPFNDVFGFYISGPGVGTDVNIALVPGTGEFVAINTVNHLENTQYFQLNSNPLGPFVQYNGFTVSLMAFIDGLIPCETYHLQLVIADGVDAVFDSGVFVEAIESDPVVVLTATSNGLDYMVEGCNTGTITFAREEANDFEQDITYYVGGTAANGVDYLPELGDGQPLTPITITIPAGETEVSFDIDAIADLLPEGVEYITIYLDNPACTGNEVIDSINFYIYDVLEVAILPENPSICVGQCVELTGTTIAEELGTFAWSGGEVIIPDSLVVEVCPTITTTYTLTANVGACTATDEVTVQVSAIALHLDAFDSECFTNGTGSIEVTVSDAIPPYTYQWTGPDGYTSTNGNISGLMPGEYCVLVTDSAGCIAESCIVISQSDEMVVNSTLSDYTCHPISCYNACDGAINLDVTGGAGNYTYIWSGPNSYASGVEDVSNLCAGSYEVTVQDSAGCQVIQNFLLQQPDSLVLIVIGTVDLLCTGVETGQASVETEGGCGPFTYTWSHDANETGPVASNLGSGTYNVSVSDVNGCSNDGTVTIVINDPIDPLTVVLDSISVYPGGFNTSCPGSEDGFVDLIVAGGSLPYTFSWYSENEEAVVSTDEDLIGMPCGEYTVTVTDDNGCVFSGSYIITCVPAINATYETTPNPCGAPEAGIGAIEITTIGGGHGAPYTWTWSGPSCPCPSDSTITNLNSGDYQLTIMDSLGCSTVININVGENDVFTAGGTVTDLSCYEICDGMIDVEIVPPGNYDFEWTGPNGYSNTLEDATNLCAGDYTVIISADDCSETFTFTVTQPVEIEIDGVITEPICFGQNNGSIDITVTNGSGEYEYEWTGGCFPPVNEITEDIFSLFECTYTVVVTDTVSDCMVSENFTLDAPEVMELIITTSEYEGGYNVGCNAANDGWIDIDVVGGTPDCNFFSPECYLIDWLGADCAEVDPSAYGNDPNSSFIDGLPAGAYGINVTDINGCLATSCIDLLEPDTLASNPIISNIECADPAGGNLDPVISGGTPPYQYSWTGPVTPGQQDDAVLIGIDAGTYTLTVTDANECQKVFEYEITETIPPDAEIESIGDVSCFGVCDGGVIFNIDPQSAAIAIATLDGNAISVSIGQNSLNGLCAGSHTVVLTDVNDCTTTLTFSISSPEELIATLTSITQYDDQVYDLQCFGDADGQLISNITGGTIGYTLEWVDENDVVIGTDVTIVALTVGEYCLHVIDNNGCTDTVCYEITQPETPLMIDDSVTVYNELYNVTCFDATDGAIDITVSGGVPDYIYQWTGIGVVVDAQDQTGLGAGSYVVLVVDSNYCDMTLNFTLTEPEQIDIAIDEVTQPTCDDACDGTASITASGGVAPYSYEWSGPDGFTSSDEDLTDLCEGTYTVTVTDANGCTQTASVDITDPLPVVATIVADYNCATGNYDLCIVASGGTGVYTYDWSTGETTQCITVDIDGEVCVTVTDENGCEVEVCDTYDVSEVLTITGQVSNTTCGQCNGAIDVTITGGIGNYTINWTGNGTVQGQEDQQDLCTGSYTITVTDENDCPSTATFVVGEEDDIIVNLTTVNVSCFGLFDGSASVTITGALDPLDISWSDADGFEIETGPSVTDLGTGTYTMDWADAGGCSGELPFTITQPDALVLEFTTSQFGDYNISTVGGSDGCIYLDVEGGTPAYTYTWTPSAQALDTLCNVPAGEYSVQITDANGCTIDTLIVLTQPEELKLPTGLSPNGDGFNDTYYIPGAYLCRGSLFKVFNRWGNKVYEKSNYDNDWYGQTSDGGVLADGTYFVIFEGCDKEFNTYVDLRRE